MANYADYYDNPKYVFCLMLMFNLLGPCALISGSFGIATQNTRVFFYGTFLFSGVCFTLIFLTYCAFFTVRWYKERQVNANTNEDYGVHYEDDVLSTKDVLKEINDTSPGYVNDDEY